MKSFSLGSKKNNAKQINIHLKSKHIWFGVGLFIFIIIFHTFIYSPFTQKEYFVKCFDNNSKIKIIDNMDKLCGLDIPINMTSIQIYNYISNMKNPNSKLNIDINITNGRNRTNKN